MEILKFLDKIGVWQLPLFNYLKQEGMNDNSLRTFMVEYD